MKKSFLLIPIAICFLAACSTTEKADSTILIEPTINPSLQISEYFPLQQDAYWVYEGTVRYTIPNSSDVAEQEISWKMEDIPLISGKKFCDTLSLTRADGRYCWLVGDASLVTEEILGVDSSEPLVEFPIFQGTMPDSSRFHFIPGVGISQYSYRHSGTVSEANVCMIEYYSGE